MDGAARNSIGALAQRRTGERTEVTIGEVRADVVEADILIGDDDLDEDGAFKPQAVMGVADRLTMLGAGLNLAARQSVLRVETSLRQFGRDGDRLMSGTARRLHRSAAAMVWQVTMTKRGGGEEPLALVTQSLAIDIRPGPDTRVSRPVGDGPSTADAGRDAAGRAAPSPVSLRREQIAAAAADIIARKGFAGASIREIADAAGMHVPTLYQYVASKDELLELVYSRTMAALQTDLEAEVAGYGTAEAKLRAAITILIGRSDRFRHRIGLLNRELKSLSPKARARVIDQYRELIGSTAAIVRMGVASGEFRDADPDIAANLVDGACDMWALRQFAVGRFGMEAFGEEIAELIVRGLRRDQPAGV